MKPIVPLTVILASLAVMPLAWMPLARAQTAVAPGVAAPAPAKGITFSAKRQQWIGDTLRLDGNARFISPGELDASADAIAIDLGDKKLSQVRALGNVKLKVDVPARNGSAPLHVESSSRTATLDPRTKVLTLTGNVAGWFQPKGGAKVALGGESVAVTFDKANVAVELNSGATPVAIAVPLPDAGPLAGVGTVTVTSKKANLNQNAESTFTGGARAFSNGARKFDVTADSFSVTRGPDGTLDTLKTNGRTVLLTDLPAGTPAAGSIGVPVRLEVSADSSVVKKADNTLTFDGNVKGLYVLRNPAGELTSYPFTGDRAVLTLIPATATTRADFNFEFSGGPAAIQAPRFDLGL